MKKLEVLLAGLLVCSPALFAQQQSTSQPDQQSTTQSDQSAAQTSTQSSQTSQEAKAASGKLTADQKAELKQLKAKEKQACQADQNSDACKSAQSDLKAKMDEYGVKPHNHNKGASSGQSQSPQ